MKRLLNIWAAMLLWVPGLHAQYRSTLQDLDDSETVRTLKEHVATLSAAQLEGRKAGSEGEKMAADYLEAKFREYGLDILTGGREFGVAAQPDTLHSRNVMGLIEGWDKAMNRHYIVVGARMDNLGTDTLMVDGEATRRIYYGANSNASGMAMMLELARKLSYSRTLLRRSVIFVGFGASQHSFAGSWYFLNRVFEKDVDKIDAMVDLDVLGGGAHKLSAFTSANEDLNTIMHALEGELLPVQAESARSQPYPSDNIVFYDREIPSVLFTTGSFPEYGTGKDSYDIIDFEGMEASLEYIYSYVQRLCNGQKPLFRNDTVVKESVPADVYAYSDVDVKPLFLNSQDPRTFMERWVYQYLKYPKYAQENGIQGRVLVSFVVNEKGEVRDVKITRGIHSSLDEEAVRVISASPKWRPGRHRGKKVKTILTTAVDFKLDKKKGSFGINGIKIN